MIQPAVAGGIEGTAPAINRELGNAAAWRLPGTCQATALIYDAAHDVTPFVPKMVSSANRLESFRDALEEQRTTESQTRVCRDPGARKDDLKVFETLVRTFGDGSLTYTKRKKNVRALDIVLDVPRTPGAPLKS